MHIVINKRSGFSLGLVFLFIYILFSYIATDIVISSKYNSYALYLFLIWGVISTALSIKNGNGKLELNTYTTWYLFFYFISFLTMIYSPAFSILSGTSYLMIVSLILTFFAGMAIKTDSDFTCVCWFYAIAATSIILILFISGNLHATSSNRLGTDVYGNANTFAEMIMIAVLLEIWLLIYSTKTIKTKIVIIFMLIIETYSLFLSGGRKSLVIPIVFSYLLLCLKTDSKGRRKIIKYTLVIAAIVLIIWNLITKIELFYNIIGYRMLFLLNGFTGKGFIGASANIRATMRETAIEGWLRSPIWGHGFDSYKYYGEIVVGKFAYSHCNYTELLYNGGVILFLVYYYIHFTTIYKSVKYKKSIPLQYRAFSIAMIISLLVYDYGCVTYAEAEVQMMLMLACKTLSITYTEELQ